jgi:hypothetical protein
MTGENAAPEMAAIVAKSKSGPDAFSTLSVSMYPVASFPMYLLEMTNGSSHGLLKGPDSTEALTVQFTSRYGPRLPAVSDIRGLRAWPCDRFKRTELGIWKKQSKIRSR